MPYEVKKQGSQWVVYNPDTGKVYGKHKTKKEAIQQQRALYTNANPKQEKTFEFHVKRLLDEK